MFSTLETTSKERRLSSWVLLILQSSSSKPVSILIVGWDECKRWRTRRLLNWREAMAEPCLKIQRPRALSTGYRSLEYSPQVVVNLAKHEKFNLAKSWKVIQFSSVAWSCPTFCNPINCSTPGLPVHHQLPEFIQTHVHQVGDAINHLTLGRPLLLLPSVFPSIRVFSNESALHIRWPKCWSLSFNIRNEHPGLISFRMENSMEIP